MQAMFESKIANLLRAPVEGCEYNTPVLTIREFSSTGEYSRCNYFTGYCKCGFIHDVALYPPACENTPHRNQKTETDKRKKDCLMDSKKSEVKDVMCANYESNKTHQSKATLNVSGTNTTPTVTLSQHFEKSYACETAALNGKIITEELTHATRQTQAENKSRRTSPMSSPKNKNIRATPSTPAAKISTEISTPGTATSVKSVMIDESQNITHTFHDKIDETTSTEISSQSSVKEKSPSLEKALANKHIPVVQKKRKADNHQDVSTSVSSSTVNKEHTEKVISADAGRAKRRVEQNGGKQQDSNSSSVVANVDNRGRSSRIGEVKIEKPSTVVSSSSSSSSSTAAVVTVLTASKVKLSRSQTFVDAVYVGTVKGGLMHGRGTLRQPHSVKAGKVQYEIYTGEYICGKRHGVGRYVFANGDNFTGHWKDNLSQGFGMQSWLKCGTYTGNFVDDQMCGVGRMEYIKNDCEKYEGEWKDGLFHGRGIKTYTSKAGKKRECGMFRNDKFIINDSNVEQVVAGMMRDLRTESIRHESQFAALKMESDAACIDGNNNVSRSTPSTGRVVIDLV